MPRIWTGTVNPLARDVPDHPCTQGSHFQILSEVHPCVWDSWPEVRLWSWLKKDFHKSLNLRHLLAESKSNRDQWALRLQNRGVWGVCTARSVLPRVHDAGMANLLLDWAPPVLLLCREMPRRICVDPRQWGLCVRHGVLRVLQNRFVCKRWWPLLCFGLLEKKALRRHPPPRRQHCDFCNLPVVFLT